MSSVTSLSIVRALPICVLVLCAGLPAAAQPKDEKPPENSSERFASLRADEVNVRAGPGVRYQVKWVFVRKLLPVQITADFESWRKIRDSEGAEGWVHRAMLSGKRTVIVTGEIMALRRSPEDTAPAVARLSPGVVAELETCQPQWCGVTVQPYSGWVRRNGLWGLKEDEIIE
ncbi:MAG: SH3 domain-containing protein [Alphaproteobacteria bacterium]